MRKSISILLASTMVSGLFLAPVVNGETVVKISLEEENKEIENPNFFAVTGKIAKITEETKGNFYATVENDQETFGFYFNKETLVLDNTGKSVELKEGQSFSAFIDATKPMILIYPPRYSPEVIIVQSEHPGTVQLEQFDKNLLNKEKDLKIHVSDKTVMTNLAGSKVSVEEIVDKDVLIFYEVRLESYPVQIGPQKIILLEHEQSDIDKARSIAEKDQYEVNGVKMIPLRMIAEQLGYKVESTGNGAIVSKGALSFTITRGEKTYGYNKALNRFEEAPDLFETNKTYVPIEFLELLIEHY